MSKKHPILGSILSNVDRTITPQERSEREKDERNLEVVERAIKESPEVKFHGALSGKGNQAITARQEKWDASDIRARRDNGEKVIPLFIVPMDNGDFRWILTDADEEACRQGYICPSCLEWQRFPNLPKCENPHGFSCGFKGGM